MINKTIKGMAMASMVLLATSCSTVPLTGRMQASLVSDGEMNTLAATSYKEFLTENSKNLVTNTAEAKKVKDIGNKIAAAVTKYMNDNGLGNQIADFKWEFNLIKNNEVNAWCMPGGKVAVFTGILPKTLNDAGLATVMGHEIAHAIARHSAERYSQQMIAAGIGNLAGAAVAKTESGKAIFDQVFGVGTQAGVLLPNSRKQEAEADRLGLTFMAMAGYDPAQAVFFWERMSSGNAASTPEFLSTHPSDASRIANIKKYLPEALTYYKK